MSSINIIGSGIMGMLTAHELLKKGYQVHLFDQGLAGQESTWAGGGIISPLFPWRYDDAVTRLSLLSQRIYADTIDSLRAYADIDPEYRQSGLLMMQCDDLDEAQAWAQKFNVDYEQNKLIDKDFPHLNPDFNEALWMPQIHQIRNPRFAKLAKQSLIEQGATFHEHTPITKISCTNNSIKGIYSHQQFFESDLCLVCTGAWTGDLVAQLLSEHEHEVKIQPVHGQMLLLNSEKRFFNEIILNDGRYIIPRKDGRTLVGSTTEMIGFKKQTSASIKQELLDYAGTLIPQLKQAKVEHHWSGLRPGSVKGIPTMSQHPDINNLFINAGHYRNGLVTSAASALLMSQVICRETPSIDMDAYSL